MSPLWEAGQAPAARLAGRVAVALHVEENGRKLGRTLILVLYLELKLELTTAAC